MRKPEGLICRYLLLTKAAFSSCGNEDGGTRWTEDRDAGEEGEGQWGTQTCTSGLAPLVEPLRPHWRAAFGGTGTGRTWRPLVNRWLTEWASDSACIVEVFSICSRAS